MKKFIAFLLVAVMVLSFAACGGGAKTPAGPVYTVDATEVDGSIYPADYPLIPYADFEASFNKFKAANSMAEIENYQDVVDLFGVDGAYYKNCDVEETNDEGEVELYKSYGWYADEGTNMIVIFKADGKDLNFYMYVSDGIY